MLLFIFILMVCLALYSAYALLWPESYLKIARPELTLIWKRPRLRPDSTHQPRLAVAPAIDKAPHPDPSRGGGEMISAAALNKIEKLEALLFEKNRTIDRLQNQLENERSSHKEFDTVKEVMDDEIKHLREQLRAFRAYYKENADA